MEYLGLLKVSKREVKCLPTKSQGIRRPLLLGQELDQTVQGYIISLLQLISLQMERPWPLQWEIYGLYAP